jgi:poly-gamma-glutamate synthesis protein (capsule biosynthesis protein)
MRLASDFAGDDDRSMAADNTSAYNCRRVAGSDSWSAHAFGGAIDINPVENPYLVDGVVRPVDGRSFARLDRSAGASVPAGVIRAGDAVVRAFAAIGWEWGGSWASPDYQHFAARPN